MAKYKTTCKTRKKLDFCSSWMKSVNKNTKLNEDLDQVKQLKKASLEET